MITSSKRSTFNFIAGVAAIHLVFFVLAACYTRIYNGDSFEYIYEAINIRHLFFFYSGNPALPITPEYMTQRMPGYPLLLFIFYLFAINNWIVLVFQNALSVFNIYLLRKTLFKIGYNQKYDLLLFLFVAAYPAQFINADTITPDILLQTFTMLYFACAVDFIRASSIKSAIYLSLALIAGMMVKPVLYPYTLVHVLFVVIVAATQKMKMQRPVLIAAIPICCILLYNFLNYTRTGKFHFTSNQAFNALYYYYPYISSQQGADSASRFLAAERGIYNSIPDYSARFDYANQRGVALLKSNFFPYLIFHLENSARMLVEPGKAEIDLFTGKLTYGHLYHKDQIGFYATLHQYGIAALPTYLWANPSIFFAVIIFLFNCLRLWGIALFAMSRRIPFLYRALTIVMIAFFAIAAGPIANTRYFLPVSLIAVGTAVMGLQLYYAKKNIARD